ncbi:MAG: YvcK family protein [Caldilineaceae bacterium]|nr:YvcK family protein [Caldilineaceae bacterium]
MRPDHPRAYPEVIRSILQADLIVAGPGSFFTSVMPNLLVPAIRDAICATTVPRLYLCNVATQPGETDGYSVSDHMRKLEEHAPGAFPMVLANANYDPAHPPYKIGEWVKLPEGEPTAYRLFTGDVVDDKRPWHHSPEKLAARLLAVYQELVTGAATATSV